MKTFFLVAFIFQLFLIKPVFAAEKKKVKLPKVLGGVVRSKEWRMKRKTGEEEFTGDVSYKMPGYEINSDWALYSRKRETIKLRGNVQGKKMWEDDSITQANAYSGRYSVKLGKIWLFPSPQEDPVTILHTDPKHGDWESTSDTAVFDEKTRVLTLDGNTEISGYDIQSKSDSAKYTHPRTLPSTLIS